MSVRYRLYRAGQPFWYALLTRTTDLLASLSLAVILIFGLAATLAFATFVEARYGTPSVQFFVYQTWWFDALLILLALNILFAAMVRYPWKRYQTGFVITHIGLLVLIGGAALSRLYGIDSQVMVFEDQTQKWAWGDKFKIKLREVSAGDSRSTSRVEDSDRNTQEITFLGGPMNWSDYTEKFTFAAPLNQGDLDWRTRVGRSLVRGISGALFRLPFRHRSGDLLFKRDDLEIRVLDYYSNSALEGPLKLKIGGSIGTQTIFNEEDGTSREVEADVQWSDAPSLFTTAVADKKSFPLGFGGKQMVGGGFLVFTLAVSQEQVDAFLNAKPTLPLGEKGVVVLYAQGKRLEFAVDEKIGKGKFSIPDTPFEVELALYTPVGSPKVSAAQEIEFEARPNATSPDNPLVNLVVWKGDQKVGRLSLLSEAPDLNIYDYENGVFGAYWFDQSGRPMQERMQKQISPRIEILRSPDQKLYYRNWNLSEVVETGELPTSGGEKSAVNAFKMRLGQLKMFVERYTPCDGPGRVPVPVEFNRNLAVAASRPAVLLEVTSKSPSGEVKKETRWLRAAMPADPTIVHPDDRLLLTSGGRQFEMTMLLDVVDIGFRVKLDKFERKLDPGTSQASHYSSTIDLLDWEHDRQIRYLDNGKSQPRDLKLEDVAPAAAIVVDPLRGDLFTADQKSNLIWRIPNDAEKKPTQLTTQIDGEVVYLGIDSESRKLYWLEKAAARSGGAQLKSIELSGGAPTRVHAFSAPPLALTVSGSQVYYIDALSGDLVQFNLEEKKEQRLEGGLDEVVALTLTADGKTLYLANGRTREILEFRDDALRTAVKLPEDHFPLTLTPGADADSLFIGARVVTKSPPGASKPPPERKPDAILRFHRKDGEIQTVARQRIYTPSAICVDPQSGRIYWVQTASMGEQMWITMNAPIDVDDPRSGRSYRLFQESYGGPYRPGTAEFDELVPPSVNKEELYMSVLSVNYDPGRGVRSAGCVLVIIGVAVMFFMRAYFFKPRTRSAANTPASRTAAARSSSAAVAT